jgi:putative ABC transport system substrate-binding protein
LAAWLLRGRSLRSQQAGTSVVAFLQRSAPIRGDFTHFRDGLATLGYEDGRNVRIEKRYAEGNDARLRELAHEVVKLNPTVIVVDGMVTTAAGTAQTTTRPVVTTIISDPERLLSVGFDGTGVPYPGELV